jgi:hypothetical protein
MIRHYKIFYIFAAFVFLSACSRQNDQNIILLSSDVIERDAGMIVEDCLHYDFLVGGTEHKEISKVVVCCGCTILSLRNGDYFDYSKPFQVDVQLNRLYYGKATQTFLIEFTDHSVIVGKLLYDYVPLPFVNREELVFLSDTNFKEVVFYFPNEENVTIQRIVSPEGIIGKRKIDKTKKYEFSIIFTIDYDVFHGASSGIIEIFTSSNRKQLFALSYIVLRH